jgi:hypothetical protein
MKITNKLGLPQALVDAVSQRPPSGNYSASMLTKSPRMVQLARRHSGEMEQDVADMIWAIFGTAVHKVIETAEPPQSDKFLWFRKPVWLRAIIAYIKTRKTIKERYQKIELSNGQIVSGIADLYHDGKISDWKTVSVWSYIYFDGRKLLDYEAQLNTYALLYELAGYPVRQLEIVMLFRDWQRSKAKYDIEYPQHQVQRVPIKLWPAEKTEAYLLERTNLFESHKDTPDSELPLCTDAERWARPGKFAVMKKGRKSALRLLDTIEQAEEWKEKNGGDSIDQREGQPWVRCEYCNAAQFCNQYKEAQID